MKNAHKVIEKAADRREIMTRILKHGNPAVRRAAELMKGISELHRRNDYSALNHQIAENALFYLPISEVERIQRELNA